ncbi:unnamed protein product [Soboliphyme baturini]|uniref:SAC domain-containing protein n=1 Tax=Soboliphyme baturini TaxID=241478 RepID=A0A183ILS5_9BILA|nr:unnamed protein product [Soboliphyme baturini]
MVVPLFQRLTLYETKARFYIVASNYGEKLYHVLKLDRTEVDRLVIAEDRHEYSDEELTDLLTMISNSSIEKTAIDGDESRCTLVEKISFAYGVVGFVRFTTGYYVILITKAVPVAKIGYEIIYKIEDTAMFYIPLDRSKTRNAKEQRYLKIFQSVDLSTNFYFCYTYDLSRTLQSNFVMPRSRFAERFVWNLHLIEPLFDSHVTERWILPVIHGFVKSVSLNLHCLKAQLVLIARRSSRFAGTRFLRRGANCKGDVANEVETEQIVYDKSVLSFKRGRFLSFVQLRGSVPFRWSQAVTGMVSKPDLKQRYGDPIVVVNLVKRREKLRREHLLNDEFRSAVSYLNQFVGPRQRILYLSFDLARCHKRGDALAKLEEIAHSIVDLNGWFQSFPSSPCLPRRPSRLCTCSQCSNNKFALQHGVSRTNCVDCLDRTNVAQFVVGKVALAYQLLTLGITEGLGRKLDTDICHLLEAAYDEHGDTLALQYAGSQLVHSIKTYKKTSMLQERSRDVIQTLSRYYSNTFADYDKQNAINLFLGVFRPGAEGGLSLWELPTPTTEAFVEPADVDYCAWFETANDSNGEPAATASAAVPYDCDVEQMSLGECSECCDASFKYFYQTSDLTVFDDVLGRSRLDSISSVAGKNDTTSLSLWWKKQMKTIIDETSKTAGN